MLAFITVATKLSTATAILYGSIQDAPSDVWRVQKRLEDLKCILALIDHACPMNPECLGDPEIEGYCSAKEAKLRSDFAVFEGIMAQLNANIGKAKSKSKWLLSHRDRAKKDLELLAEDIKV